MEIKRLPARHGWMWLIGGYQLFRKNPVVWSLLTTTYFVLIISANLIPVIGPILMTLLLPVFSVGFLLASKSLESGTNIHFGYLFAGFKTELQPLITLGGIYLVSIILIFGLSSLIDGGTVMKVLLFGDQTLVNSLENNNSSIAIQIVIVLHLLLLAAYWFAPALIAFNKTSAANSLLISFTACMRNLLPIFIYGLALAAVSLLLIVISKTVTNLFPIKPEIALSLSLFIAIGFVTPIIFTSSYISYREIFSSNLPTGKLDEPKQE